jgi:hypothetical protein
VGGAGVEAIERIEALLGLVPVIYVTGNIEMVAGRGSPNVDKPIAIHALAAACNEAGIAA